MQIVDNPLSFMMMSPDGLALELAQRARTLRLSRDLSQQGLADRAGVSVGTLKRFERTGQIALVTLIRLAIVLDALDELHTWFSLPPWRTLDEAIASEAAPTRQRGRKS